MGFVRLLSKAFGLSIFIGIGILAGCGSNAPDNRDTTNSGTIHISVDETFKPVIDSQILVFESQNPNAHIIVHYKPEAECLRDLNVDSIRMVIVTRGLTIEEQNTMKERLSFRPSFEPMAYDAIAVIVNNQVKDSLFTMEDIRSMAKGISGYPYKMLLDGKSATSTVRYVADSLLQGQPLSENIVAADSTEAVIDYISKNTNAIGLVGVSWIGDKSDTMQLSYLKKIKVAELECRGCKGTYVSPAQANIATDRYPMVRPLYYILKENYKGLGSGFRNFLIYEKGQMIFYRSYLLPATMSFNIRNVNISN